MEKLKVFVYSHALRHLHDSMDGYRDSVPFSEDGLRKHCEIIGEPESANLLYCGQWHDAKADELAPERFEFFSKWPQKHCLDIEGDWRGRPIPEWLRPAMLTAMNAFPEHLMEGWRVMARPGCSPLLMSMLNRWEPPPLPAEGKAFYFMGQRDGAGVREKTRRALGRAGVKHNFWVNNFWGCALQADDPLVKEYEDGFRDAVFALCPAGEGQSTQRFYEACFHGRVPVAISDNVWLGEGGPVQPRFFRLPPSMSEDELAREFREIAEWPEEKLLDYGRMNREYFDKVVRTYFRDPTKFFFDHARERGWL